MTRIASANPAIRHVFVRNLEVECLIGIYEIEKQQSQRVRINLDLAVRENIEAVDDNIENVTSYEELVTGTIKIVTSAHTNLIETLAEKIAQLCLKGKDVISVRVRVEKPDIFKEAESVGIEIERVNI